MIRLLIADDHAILRDGLRMLLEEEPDMTVVGQACNGLEAIRLASDLKPDVILMDIQMPELDGINACERIVRQSRTRRVLILSQSDDEKHLLQVLAVGAVGYVLKQNASDELWMAVRTVMRGHVYLTPVMATRLVTAFLHQDSAGTTDRSKQLTPREQVVLQGVCNASSNQEIADALSLSIKTVQSHRANLMEKLDLHDRVALVKFAIRKGLVTADAGQAV